MSTDEPPTPRRRGLALLWLALPIVGLAELGAHFYFSRRPPSVEDWLDLRPAVAALRTGGEVIVTAPAWAEPLARHAFGDELMPLDQIARSDDARVERAIEVSLIGQRAPELSGWREASSQKQGKFVLRVLENPSPERVLFDFVSSLAPTHADVLSGAELCKYTDRARVTTGGLGGPPAAPAVRFACASTFAGATVIDGEEYRARRCIWASPAGSDPLVLRYRDVPLGTKLVGFTGVPWVLGRDGIGAHFTVEVSVAGQSIGRAEHPEGTPWSRFEYPTGVAPGARGDVQFSITAEPPKAQVFCFAASARE